MTTLKTKSPTIKTLVLTGILALIVGIVVGAAGAFYALPRLPNDTLRKLIWTPLPYKHYGPIKKSLARTFKAFKYKAPYSDLSPEDFKKEALNNTTTFIKKNYDFLDFHPYYNDDGKIVYGRLRFKGKMPNVMVPGKSKAKPMKKFIDAIPVRMVDGSVAVVALPDTKGYLLHDIFNRPDIAAHPTKPILVVEGEATAAAAKKLFPDYVVISLQMGKPQSKTHAVLGALKGRDIVLWPDTDSTGSYFMHYIKTVIKEDLATPVAVVDIPEDFPTKWDLANPPPPGYSVEDLRSIANKALQRLPKYRATTKSH